MGLFEEDSVEASSKLLNVESVIKVYEIRIPHYLRTTNDILYHRRSFLEGLMPMQKLEKGLSQGSPPSDYVFSEHDEPELRYNITVSH